MQHALPLSQVCAPTHATQQPPIPAPTPGLCVEHMLRVAAGLARTAVKNKFYFQMQIFIFVILIVIHNLCGAVGLKCNYLFLIC